MKGQSALEWLLLVVLVTCGSAFFSACASSAPASGDRAATVPPSPWPAETVRSTAPVGPTASPSALPIPEPSVPAIVPTRTVPVYTYTIVRTYAHDREAFTQGLVIQDGLFYESTGLLGQSTLRRVQPETGQVLALYALPPQYFGEGIALVGDKILQLTWQSHVGLIYDKDSFELLGTFGYDGEGWGLAYDGSRLIMSDGTSFLRFLDPETLAETGKIEVQDASGPVTNLNELEYVRGQVLANVWQTDRIAQIDPRTGQVTAWIDLEGLLSPEDRDQPVDVLNGIAYDAGSDRLFVTGKLWPKVLEIELVPTPLWLPGQ